ncbi:Bug family tripartite tricarboxylate transporter substrate binding protein [Pseudorhodoferax sp.]|uniref:Bug family tripartite tricarboxylate transporter substrate binding protein n=1 Tax=Pseudorhodoferax sp. TaxID=1993553 RepID=UPI0039E5F406
MERTPDHCARIRRTAPDAARRRLAGRLFAGAWIAAAALTAAAPSAAADFPSRPVRIIVPFTPGTPGEIWMRAAAQRLQVMWGQPIIIENRPGAGGLVGAEAVARSTPDGHTLLFGSPSTAMGKLTSASIKFDPQEVLVPVRKVMNYKIVLVTNAEMRSKAKDIQEFIALSKVRPGGMFFGSTGTGSTVGVAGAISSRGLGISYTAVDYAGLAQYLVALQRDEVQYALYPTTAIKQFIDNGQLHPLVVLSDERYAELPAVPTIREAGYKGFLPGSWTGVFAPRGTPQAVIDKLSRDMQTVAFAPDFRPTIEAQIGGLTPQSDPQIFARELEVETKNLKEFFDAIGFKPQ